MITEIKGINNDSILEIKWKLPIHGKQRKIVMRVMPMVYPAGILEEDRKKAESEVITQIF